MKRIAWIILGWLVLLTTAQAASFDCGKAKTKIEKLICGDAELSKLDEDLNKAYLQALERGDVKQHAIESQRQWLKNERNVCKNAECVKAAYETRIKELGFTSSFGIVFSRPADRKISPTQVPDKLPESQVPVPPVEISKVQTGQQQILPSATDCGTLTIPDSAKLPKSKVVTKLIEIAKSKFEQQQNECAIQILEGANQIVRSVTDGTDRAVMGFEIKDVALDVIQQDKISDLSLGNRLILAATQSTDSSGKLIKKASEDERFNDTAFLGWVSDHYNHQKRNVEYRQFELTMLCLNFSLPPKRRWAEKWRLTNFLADQNRKGYLSGMADLLESAQSDVLQTYRTEFLDGLLKVAGGRMVFYHDLLPVENARHDIDALSRLLPMFKGETWGFQMYLYKAEAYWQLGDKIQARENLDKARGLVQGGSTLFLIANFLCGKTRNCPFGIYNTTEMSSLLDEIENMANTNSDIRNKLDKIQWMRKSISRGSAP